MSEGAPVVTEIKVSCGSQDPVPDAMVHNVVVDQDVDQPDMCVLTVNNANHMFSNDINLGDEVKVTVGEIDIFKGETVGIEPVYKTGGESRCVIRAFNRLHRLVRGRKSRTFVDQKDSQIASTLADSNQLQANVDETSVVNPHVYQHNLTDLEFLRMLAARNGFEVLVEERTLLFREPRADRDSGLTLAINAADSGIMLKSFSPRLSSAGLVSGVEVRSWNADRKEEVVARANASSSPLGRRIGPENASVFGERVTFTVDRPVESVEEAQRLADARLAEILMDYITGDALCIGNPELKAGIVVTMTVNPDDASDKFNGKYYIAGASHRYNHSGSGGGSAGAGGADGGGGYVTALRVRRDAEGG